MIISLVAAASENNVIGKDGGIPWDLPKDFKHFHDATKGKPIIMGRKTQESIGRILPGRRNIVITRQDVQIEGCDVVHSIKEALDLVHDAPEVCVIGGGEIYKQALPFATHIDLTRVHTTIEDGDAFFPEFSEEEWQEVSRERCESDQDHAYAYTFLVYERRH
ncbi:MAG: dihydrofolate reductase [Candidatus Peribacteraceae bacterium]|jgi:dihydrofolate reductase